MLKKNYSIDEGIEKLRSLTISDKIKANNNSNKLSELKNRIIIKNNINRNLNQKIMENNNYNSNKINQIYKRKRNYISFLNSINKNDIHIKNNTNNTIRANENINEEKKNYLTKLLFVDDFARELLKSKNEEELKKILFLQLFLLDQKKRNDKNIEQIEQSLNILETDNKDLLKKQN